MSVAKAHYVLKSESELAKSIVSHIAEIKAAYKITCANLKKALVDFDAEDAFQSGSYYGSNSSPEISALMQLPNKIAGEKYRRVGSGWMPKQTNKWGRGFAKAIKQAAPKLTCKDPSDCFRYVLFDGTKAYSGRVHFFDGNAYLIYPYLESKGDDPELPDGIKEQIEKRIRPWEFEKAVEEYNQSIQKGEK
jgi:hypothetical protein